ncbi:MAG TPA: ribosomal protein S18-alanine N-acetyltransferase [Verrucomicrobiae bacterium]|nr:ribosomal protein S18-alanine N-acetyltransferase [Verrucomicrobiae bacterium]
MSTGTGDIIILPMTEADLDQVLAIESGSFPLPWSRQHFLDELASPYSFPMVALAEGAVAGFICPAIVLDEAHILDVAVHPSFRRRGVGRLLVQAVIRECAERSAAFLGLEVRPSNGAAIELYRSFGFRETGRRKRYYENGEDALLMEYTFQEVH